MIIRSVVASLILFALLPTFSFAQAQKEIDWKPPLAEGGAPECPDHVGSRTLQSETVSNGTFEAYIIGTAVRTHGKTCQSKAELVVSGPTRKTLPLPGAADHGFSIVDFSPDGHELLLVSNGGATSPSFDFRGVSITVVGLAKGEPHFVNAWDVFGWKDCDAWVEPQGFTADGRVLLSARPPNPEYPGRHACIDESGLYATSLPGIAIRLPNDTKVPRFAKAITEQVQACKSDPDIIGACFTVHGRLSGWNGSPTLRIWRVGTNRILGDHYDWPLPENLAKHMNWDVEAWGDFEVCPFSKETPGVMQMVCIESAKNVFYRNR